MMLPFLFVLSLLGFVSASCPSLEYIHPCTCEGGDSDSIIVQCENLDNEDTLQLAMQSLKDRRVTRVTLKDSHMRYLHHDLFKGVDLEEIDLLDSTFYSLSDEKYAFEGLEESLVFLTITDCTFMSGWDWSQLRNMKNMFRIDILGGDMDAIREDVSAIHHLPIEDLAFSRNHISWITDKAFADFSNLKLLSLDYNHITTLKRSMLPNPATHLTYLNLASNELKFLDHDLFTEMPNLDNLFLHNNLLSTLDEKTFSPIWSQLEFFGATGNPLACDCRIRWMTKAKTTLNQRVVCAQPKSLKGRFTHTLTAKELHC